MVLLLLLTGAPCGLVMVLWWVLVVVRVVVHVVVRVVVLVVVLVSLGGPSLYLVEACTDVPHGMLQL